MGGNVPTNGIDGDIATAFGMFALTDASLHEAAQQCGVTRWELEDAIVDAGLSETFGIEQEGDVSETIDDLLDGG
jgi:hypothetical protein